MTMILCCGEALIDMVPDETAHGDRCMVPKSGGAVFNTAIALGRLGADVSLFTGVSNDLFGRQLTQELQNSSVSCDALVAMDAATSLAFVELTDGHADYTFYTNGAADTVLTPDDCPNNLSQVQAAFFGGISLCTDPTASTLQHLMHQASAAGCFTMIDPNIRQPFIKDEVSYRARLADMMATANIVKLSDEDLAWVAQSGGSVEDQVRHLNLPESTLVLVTKGADGSDAVSHDGRVLARALTQAVKVADTIGAGDTFNAGMLSYLADHGALDRGVKASLAETTLVAALEFANSCAAITVSRQGANPPWRNEL
ncbi:MAG: carbohydrate kinase [Pseudomonadota bacterium]